MTVTLPDGGTTKGTVTDVGTVAHKPAGQTTSGTGQSTSSGNDTATIDVTVTLDDPAAGGNLDAAPVDVDFVSAERKGVLTVPVAALLALREGGYGLEVVKAVRRGSWRCRSACSPTAGSRSVARTSRRA